MTSYEKEIMELLQGDTPKKKYESLKTLISASPPVSTRQTDINGNEMFEGDIVKVWNGVDYVGKFEICWRGYGLWFVSVPYDLDSQIFVFDSHAYRILIVK